MGFRSQAAIARRADKRNRSLAQQRSADQAASLKRQKTAAFLSINDISAHPSHDIAAKISKVRLVSPNRRESTCKVRFQPSGKRAIAGSGAGARVIAVGSESEKWLCKKCKNENWLRREVCNSKTCDERRPAGITPPPLHKTTTPAPSAKPSPASSWAPQASDEQIKKNEELLRMLKAGEAMDEESKIRAQVLKKRRERKAQVSSVNSFLSVLLSVIRLASLNVAASTRKHVSIP